MFSLRSGFDLTRNRLARLLDEKRAAGAPLLDLTATNPTQAGFRHPGPEALAALADARALRYEPAPRGLAGARAAVAAYYAARGVPVSAERLLLTASTSEAYAYLFKLLCDDGDEVLVPQPSYPLLEFLAGLEGVALRRYRCEYAGGRWAIDLDSLRAGLGPRSRAVVLVSPNNPTGAWVREEELARLDALAAERGLALVCDEVFADFAFAGGSPPVAAAVARRALTFTLSGLSKACGLPQVKLGWLLAGGPAPEVAAALGRLELVADTYLSVSTPVQVAAAPLLAAGVPFRAECGARVRANRARLDALAAGRPSVEHLAADGGWSSCLRVPRLHGEEELVLALLREDDVVVHPGYFFDFPEEAYLVLSLLPPEPTFALAAERLFRRLP